MGRWKFFTVWISKLLMVSLSSSTVRIGERVVNNVPPKDRDIAMVFQSYALYPHKTVEANMVFALKLRKTDKALVQERLNTAAEILGLTPYLKRYPRQLSGGQRQRVAMGRAIVRDPQVFLFDEPLSNLDAKLRVQMRKEIKELHQRLRTTTIFVTHDQVEAMTMADKIVVMNDGNVEQIGTPLELYNTPVNRFVATFIGSPAMNMIEASYRARDNSVVTAHGIDMPLAFSPELEDGAPLVLGVRPEHIDLSSNGFQASVTVVEPMGSETLVFAKVGEEEITIMFRDHMAVAPGETISLALRPQSIHLFDPSTETRIFEGA